MGFKTGLQRFYRGFIRDSEGFCKRTTAMPTASTPITGFMGALHKNVVSGLPLTPKPTVLRLRSSSELGGLRLLRPTAEAKSRSCKGSGLKVLGLSI